MLSGSPVTAAVPGLDLRMQGAAFGYRERLRHSPPNPSFSWPGDLVGGGRLQPDSLLANFRVFRLRIFVVEVMPRNTAPRLKGILIFVINVWYIEPDEIIRFFSRPNPSSSTMALRSTELVYISKAILVTGRGGLQGCEMLRIPQCLDNRHTVGSKAVSLTHRPRSILPKDFLVLISVRG
jgi:hypothetical protein